MTTVNIIDGVRFFDWMAHVFQVAPSIGIYPLLPNNTFVLRTEIQSISKCFENVEKGSGRRHRATAFAHFDMNFNGKNSQRISITVDHVLVA